jgi:purine-binding chemotaxis protein CheW
MVGTAVIFQIGEKRLALLVQHVERVLQAVEITALIERSRHMLGVINVEGKIVPVGDMRTLLGLKSEDIRLDDFIIIGKMGEQNVAIIANMVEGTIKYNDDQCVTVKSANDDFCIAGILNIEDDLIMICDLAGCFASEKAFLTKAD